MSAMRRNRWAHLFQRMLIAPSYQRIVAAGMHELMAVPVGQVVGQMRARPVCVCDVMLDLQQEYLDAVSRSYAIRATG